MKNLNGYDVCIHKTIEKIKIDTKNEKLIETFTMTINVNGTSSYVVTISVPVTV